jgi:hypothetical protein
VNRHWIRIGILFSSLACTLTVRGQAPAYVAVRQVAVAWHGTPALTFSVRDFADAEVLKKLQSGLPQTLVTRAYAYGERDREPLALAALSCRVVYDLWDGTYRVERQTEKADRTVNVKGIENVLATCLDVSAMSLGDVAAFARQHGRSIYFAVAVELNPLSEDTIERIRRWLARPVGNELNGNAFFGSFVSIFVGRKLGSAEKSLSFRSELVVVPP